MKKTYAEKLLDPRWQKLRLLVLQRDGFKCTLCRDAETELHIHHEEYSGDPWEAPVEKLKTLCKHCHKIVEALKSLNLSSYKIIKKRHHSCYLFYLFSEYESKRVISIIKIPDDTEEPEFVTGIHSELVDVFYEFVHQNNPTKEN
jgi:hypothetical protein